VPGIKLITHPHQNYKTTRPCKTSFFLKAGRSPSSSTPCEQGHLPWHSKHRHHETHALALAQQQEWTLAQQKLQERALAQQELQEWSLAQQELHKNVVEVVGLKAPC
jgi:hypothetical protein